MLEQVATSSPKPEDGDLAVAPAQGMDLYKGPRLKTFGSEPVWPSGKALGW